MYYIHILWIVVLYVWNRKLWKTNETHFVQHLFQLCLNCKGCPTCVSNCVKTSHISDSNCHLVPHRLSPVFCLKSYLVGIKGTQIVKPVFLDLVLSQEQTSHSSRSWRKKWLTGQMSNYECPQFSHFWIFRPERPPFNWGRPRIQIKPLKFSLSS